MLGELQQEAPAMARAPIWQQTIRSTRREEMEARAGIEPAHKGFADLSLTTWVPRLAAHTLSLRCRTHKLTCGVYRRRRCFWSGRPGSNRRHLPWQGSTLPLSYSRPANTEYSQKSRLLATRQYYCGAGAVGCCGAVVSGGNTLRGGIAFGCCWGSVCCGAGAGGGWGGGVCSSVKVSALGFGL